MPWRHRQALVNQKLLGYAFAMALGVRSPVETPPTSEQRQAGSGVGFMQRVSGAAPVTRAASVDWFGGKRLAGIPGLAFNI